MVEVLEPLENRTALEVEVAPAPQENLSMRKFTVIGNVQKYSYHQWLKKKAFEIGVHGSIQNKCF